MVRPFACRNCRRPLHWSEATGWLHGELPQYAHEPITCERALPSCMYSNCDHTVSGPDDECPCNCHVSGAGPPPMDCAKDKAHLYELIRLAFPENRGEPKVRGRLTEVVNASGLTREYVARIRDGKVTKDS